MNGGLLLLSFLNPLLILDLEALDKKNVCLIFLKYGLDDGHMTEQGSHHRSVGPQPARGFPNPLLTTVLMQGECSRKWHWWRRVWAQTLHWWHPCVSKLNSFENLSVKIEQDYFCKFTIIAILIPTIIGVVMILWKLEVMSTHNLICFFISCLKNNDQSFSIFDWNHKSTEPKVQWILNTKNRNKGTS